MHKKYNKWKPGLRDHNWKIDPSEYVNPSSSLLTQKRYCKDCGKEEERFIETMSSCMEDVDEAMEKKTLFWPFRTECIGIGAKLSQGT